MKFSVILKTVLNTTNMENTGNMVKSMKKHNSNSSNKGKVTEMITVADFPVLISVKEKISRIFPKHVRWNRRFREKFKRERFREI